MRLGRITYANCAPFFHFLREVGFVGEIISGVPTELNNYLASGTIDVSPSSSFEYARNWRDYVLLPDLSISADGPVKSVLLFSSVSPEKISPNTEIAITGESATSVNLLKIIFQEYYGWDDVRVYVPQDPLEQVIAAGKPALLIGDRALRCTRSMQVPSFDMSSMWKEFTGLPFVFALWIARREIADNDPRGLEQLHQQLLLARDRAFQQLATLAKDAVDTTTMTEDQLLQYWRQMEYGLSPSCLAGLKLYFRLATKYGLLTEEPEIHFI